MSRRLLPVEMARVLVVDDAARHARHHHAREGRPHRPLRDHEPRPERARDHVLRARPGVEGHRVDRVGARDFVVKPFKAERVQEAVAKALA